MDAALDNAVRLLQLGFPAALGAAAGAAGLFSDPRQAVSVLNRYALNFGFPALILHGLLKTTALPDEVAFWLLWPLSLAILLAGIRLLAPRRMAGTLALVAAFGNVAYLGLPYVLAVYGPSIAGPAALAVSIHAALAVMAGPLLLERWGQAGAGSWREATHRVSRLPLFWAPIAGLSARVLPDTARATALGWIDPIAASAAPVALFLIGLHLFVERRRLATVDAGLLTHLAIRQLAAPLVVAGLAVLAVQAGLLSPALAQVQVLLASMPAAITTFSMAHNAGIGEDRVAAVIVWSSALALLLLPAWGWLAGALLY